MKNSQHGSILDFLWIGLDVLILLSLTGFALFGASMEFSREAPSATPTAKTQPEKKESPDEPEAGLTFEQEETDPREVRRDELWNRAKGLERVAKGAAQEAHSAGTSAAYRQAVDRIDEALDAYQALISEFPEMEPAVNDRQSRLSSLKYGAKKQLMKE